MSTDRIHAHYVIETGGSLESAAAAMAGEQSTGTFVALPGETPELHARHAATVERITPLDDAVVPSLSGAVASADSRYRRAEVELSFPLENVGTALPNLLATVAGNLFELQQLSGIRLEALDLPPAFGAAHPGPQFGIEGTRRLAGVQDRPIIGTIIKPSVGLTPDETAALAGDLARAGLDFIKDDELMANSPHSPFDERLSAVMHSLQDAADDTGALAMYAVNVTDELDEMLRHVDAVAEAGGTCVMVSVNAVGLGALRAVRERSSLPIHAHRNGWGAMTRHPLLGYSYAVWSQLWRLAGADQLHVNGLRNKFWEPDASVLRSARACLRPENGHPAVMPVFSSAQSADQAADTYAALGTVDLMYVCGGGIMAHPDGPAAGATSIRQAWRAAVDGVPASEYAQTHAELAAALSLFAR
ncbi:ribulose 1,5-bisphosphate carboxylase [Microbacterium sp. PAMC 28756]|jgi:ribulose-bisphosphate carboxylase large chain|uniref:ribulose-bisphosphate carboxylase large subunit family protein n=1 Tax=Actinomycetes TaxID=1760 RepID=UPI00076B180C|nr:MULTISPECIES: ribulose-bisphosphate carboxylase large subunit family protein [unclassified Microbacterium]AMG83121.1 ribulose 1,5-bisphosphate carboxylase [Microbacterium sp. PAMC 28756]OSP08577.1 ribulose 1,5-bisphosphate carboxylase [Microbacterium sp. LEMMJ01]